MQIPFIISLIISATTLPSISPTIHQELFQQSISISFSKSKRTLKSIYLKPNKNRTLYCSCSFDSDKQINNDSCDYSPRIKSNKRSQQLEFEHVVPAHALGQNLQCWKKPICSKRNGKKYRGRKCCSKVSDEFQQMQSDMHNLFPTVGEVNGDRSNLSLVKLMEKNGNTGSVTLKLQRELQNERNPSEKILHVLISICHINTI